MKYNDILRILHVYAYYELETYYSVWLVICSIAISPHKMFFFHGRNHGEKQTKTYKNIFHGKKQIRVVPDKTKQTNPITDHEISGGYMI